MWVRLDDQLGDHPKILRAGAAIGANGPALAIGVYVLGLLWTNKHLTDGELPAAVVQHFRSHLTNPTAIAEALVEVGLWERRDGGFYVHDYGDFNPAATDVKALRAARRDDNRLRQQRYRAARRQKAGTS